MKLNIERVRKLFHCHTFLIFNCALIQANFILISSSATAESLEAKRLTTLIDRMNHSAQVNLACNPEPAAHRALDLFCSNPQKFVCGWDDSQLDQYLKQHTKTRSEDEFAQNVNDFDDRFTESALTENEIAFEKNKHEGLKIIAAKIGVDSKTLTEEGLSNYAQNLLKSGNDDKGLEVLNHYSMTFTRIAKAIIFNRAGTVPETYLRTKEIFNDAKASVRKSILSAIQDPAQRVKAVEKLDAIKVFTATDFETDHHQVLDPKTGIFSLQENRSKTVNPAASAYAKDYASECSNSMHDPERNAVYDPVHNIVYVCPGFIVDIILNGARGNPALGMVIAHELGHSTFPNQSYDRVLACIEKNATDGISASLGRLSPLPDWITGSTEKKRLEERAKNHQDEIVADLYMTDYMASALAAVPETDPTARTKEQLRLIKSSYKFLCPAAIVAEGVHPKASYRITQIMRRNPQIDRLMGCRVKTGRPERACTLQGETKEKY